MIASRKDDQFSLRLPAGLRDRVKERANANGRSMNSEIIHHLERALAQPASAGNDPSKSLPADAKVTS
ncbi:Arc family DNA-binding protein [Pseudochelatococcus sp. B33]